MGKFFDTNALLQLGDDVLLEDHFYVSSITLQELEHIKQSRNKSEEVKYQARQALRILTNHEDKFTIVNFTPALLEVLNNSTVLVDSPDARIITCAAEIPDVTFVTGDYACLNLAKCAGLKTQLTKAKVIKEEYTGYKIVEIKNETEMYNIYESIERGENFFDLLINEYLILYKDKQVIDYFRWTGKKYRRVEHTEFNSRQLGRMKPRDAEQYILFDSLKNDTITLIRGAAGSGKTASSLAYIFNALEEGIYERLYIFVNPCPNKFATPIGFRKGTTTEKLLSSSTGYILSSHLGDELEVERLVAEGKIVLIPMVDMRGVSIPKGNILYLTEAQNTNKDLMKLLLQRVEDECKVIIEGDFSEGGCQIDSSMYMGENNGMASMIKAFKGEDVFGMSTLTSVHRGKVCKIAQDKM